MYKWLSARTVVIVFSSHAFYDTSDLLERKTLATRDDGRSLLLGFLQAWIACIAFLGCTVYRQ